MSLGDVDMIKQYNDVLEKYLIKDVIEYFKSMLKEDVWGSSFSWDQNLGPISANIITHKISDKSLKKEIKKNIENVLKVNFDEKDLNFIPSIYIWSSGSYITWHLDDNYPYSGTIYLNEEWDSNDGGVFLYEDNYTNEIKGIRPSYNSMVVNSGIKDDPHNSHCVTCIVPGTIKKRITLQWRTNSNKKQKLSYK